VEGSDHGSSTKRNMDSTRFHDAPHTTSSPENRLDLRLLLNQVHWSVSGRPLSETRLDNSRVLSDGSPLHLDLRMLLQWVYQDGQWKARVMLKQNELSWMVSGRVRHSVQSAW